MLGKFKAAFGADRRFNIDVLWNVASIAILGGAGVVINVVIAASEHYGDAALGVFNLAFAFYIVLAQLGVGGVHLSALKHISHHSEHPRTASTIALAALLIATLLALVVAGGTFACRGLVAWWWNSPELGRALVFVAPGLFAFCINKVLLCIINAMRHMRAYAVFQAARFILILAALLALMWLERPHAELAAALSVAELLLLGAMLAYVQLRVVTLRAPEALRPWLREHVAFGAKGCLSGALSEMNTRVDVLMLGLFTTDVRVGLYSFAAIPAEVLTQLPLVVRRNVDPVIGKHFARGETDEMNAFAARVRWLVLAAMLAVGGVAIMAYPFAVRLLVGDEAYVATWPIFAILTAGIVFNAPWRAFFGVLLQGGRPGTHTLFIAAVVLTNVVLNAALIPFFEVYGAAIATGLTFLIEAALIAILARRLFALRI